MNTTKITELDLHDVPQMYHNLKYNDGEIFLFSFCLGYNKKVGQYASKQHIAPA